MTANDKATLGILAESGTINALKTLRLKPHELQHVALALRVDVGDPATNLRSIRARQSLRQRAQNQAATARSLAAHK